MPEFGAKYVYKGRYNFWRRDLQPADLLRRGWRGGAVPHPAVGRHELLARLFTTAGARSGRHAGEIRDRHTSIQRRIHHGNDDSIAVLGFR